MLMLYISSRIHTLKMLNPRPKFEAVFSVYLDLIVLNLLLRNTNLRNKWLVSVKI